MAAATNLPPAYETIALVDVSYLFRKAWHGQARDAMPGDAAQRTLGELAGIRGSVELVVICCDAPPYKRRELFPAYKAQREKPPEELIAQQKWLMGEIEAQHYRIAKSPGAEADDVIATLARDFAVWCPDVRIVASDKDLAQCVTDNVKLYVPGVGSRLPEIRGPAEVVTKYGVAPSDMPLWLALTGDAGDNVPGVPGVGPKRAAQLITQCKTLQGIAEAIATIDEGEKPGTMWISLGKNWEQLKVSLDLVTLDSAVPLDVDSLLAEREVQWHGEQPADGDPLPRSKVTDADWDPISRAPEGAKPFVPAPAAPAPKPPSEALAKAEDFGAVTSDLQPTDLRSARSIAKWVHTGKMYPQFPTPEAVFTVILRGKELGLGVTTSLAGFHVVEGKPTASADLIRALAERDPDCEYFRCIESSAVQATWETKHRKHPDAQRYTYTAEEANQAGLRGNNWAKRPRDMLTKTAGSKLARLVYPMATLGLYAPEEFDE